jgi:hypothetical protein
MPFKIRPLPADAPLFRRLAACLLILLAAGGLILHLNGQISQRATVCEKLTDEMDFKAPCLQIDFHDESWLHSTWHWQYLTRTWVGSLAVFLMTFILYPLANGMAAALRLRWRAAYTVTALIAGAVGVFGFIVYFGNLQFGAWDHGIMIDAGWRLLQGQRLYQDFVSPMPAGFFLGVKLAYKLFGVRWISTVLVTAIFSAGCFVWMYFLFAELLGSRLKAFAAALAIESVAMLLFSYWWYNNIASVTGVVFLLSCLLYLKKSDSLNVQLSYAAALALLGFMKANTAGPLILAGVGLLFLATPRLAKARLLLWTAVATAVNVAILTVNYVSLPGLFSSYLWSVRERSSWADHLWDQLGYLDLLCSAMMCCAFLAWWPPFRRAVTRRDRRATAALLLLAAALLTSVIAMFTNLDFKDVDWPLPIAAGVLLLNDPTITSSSTIRWRVLARCWFCFLCAVVAGDVYAGTVRYRVFSIGPHMFFEWSGPLVSPGTRFFDGVRASPMLRDVMKQTAEALKDAPRPVFFGSRMEFAYAALGEPSPKDLGIFWGPGTSFPFDDESLMEDIWRKKRFPTVILVQNDTTMYSDLFVNMIYATYDLDKRWPDIAVLRLKEPKAVPPLKPGRTSSRKALSPRDR